MCYDDDDPYEEDDPADEWDGFHEEEFDGRDFSGEEECDEDLRDIELDDVDPGEDFDPDDPEFERHCE